MNLFSKAHTGKPAIWVSSVILLALLAFLVQPTLTAQRERKESVRQRSRDSGNPRIKIGEYPPDFELPILTFGEDNDGNPVGKIGNKGSIRLSSFRGKRPVCLIMSSYT